MKQINCFSFFDQQVFKHVDGFVHIKSAHSRALEGVL